jgi:16S rRNA (guanine966-N2)-methyltransferase
MTRQPPRGASRIIGGHGRGRRLKPPAGPATRPTGGRVRQSLFDILAGEVVGARFLDAFAGSGAVGLEALSRGAAKVVLVDRERAAALSARENARAVAGAGGEIQIVQQDALTALPALADQGRQFDIVYVDPPYASDLYEPLLETLGAGRLLAAGGLVVVEHFHNRHLPETIGHLVRTRTVRVGDPCLSFYRHRDAATV